MPYWIFGNFTELKENAAHIFIQFLFPMLTLTQQYFHPDAFISSEHIEAK